MTSSADLLASILGDDDNAEPELAAPAQVLKFSIDKAVLLPLLDKACTVVPSRDAMPVLKCVQMHVDPQRVRVIATDADLTLLTYTREVAVSRTGVAVFPGKKLLEIVKKASHGQITLSVTGTVASITAGATMWTLALQSGADFPLLPDLGDAAFAQVDLTAFIIALGSVRCAASRDPTRINLGVIDIAGGNLTATNGARVHRVRVPGLDIGMRITVDATDDLLRLLKLSDAEHLYVGQSASKLIFRFGRDVFIVSRVDAAFPDLDATLLRPALENRHRLWVPRAELQAAIRRVRINADTDSAAIALNLSTNTVVVATRDAYGNTASEAVACDYAGPERSLVVHHGYLTDMINTYGESTCTFKLGDDTKTRRSPLMLLDEKTGSVSLTQQMQTDWA